MSDIWFTSDLHFWHANVIKYCNRPYFSVEEMNEALIYNWNNIVKENDTIYVLGDFSFSGRSIELYSHRLNGKKKIIFGNHDPGHPYNKHYKKAVKRGEIDYWKKFYERHGWEVLPLVHTLDISGVAVVNMSHIPYNNIDPRYTEYLPKDDGRWLLHGHIHSNAQINLDKRMIDVGVDANNYTPVSIERIKELILCLK